MTCLDMFVESQQIKTCLGSKNWYDCIILVIKSIPEFIAKILNEVNDKKNKNNAPRMIGKFYLGLNYDYQ